MSFYRTALASLMLVGFSFGEVSIAFAQGIEEIVVTARKREESLQTIPVAVTAFGAEQMASQTIEDLADIDNLVPNFQMSGSDVVIRGQRRGVGQIVGDPGVALYFDGVYIGRSNATNIGLADAEQVEILRGPQGTLFGRNTTGGALNVKTALPGYEFSGDATIRVGNNTWHDYYLRANVPLIEDQLALRVAFESNNRDSLGDNIVTGQEIGTREQRAVIGSLLWEPNDTTEIVLRGDWSDAKQENPFSQIQSFNLFDPKVSPGAFGGILFSILTTGEQALVPDTVAAFNGAGGFGGMPASLGAAAVALNAEFADKFLLPDDPHDRAVNAYEFNENANYGFSGTITKEFDDFTAKAILAKRNVKNQFAIDTDGTPFTLLHSNLTQEVDWFTAEVQFLGDAEIWGFDLDWIGGAYYLKEKGAEGSASPQFPAVNPAILNYLIADGVNKSAAGFAQINVDLTEDLTLTAGGRYTRDTKELIARHSAGASTTVGTHVIDSSEFESTTHFLATLGIPAVHYTTCTLDPAILPDPGVCARPTKDKFDAFSWTFGLDYAVVEGGEGFFNDMMVYVKTSRGFKAGGQNLRQQKLDNSFDPEFLTDYEIGIKADLLDGGLRVNLALFDQNYKGIQVEQVELVSGSPVTVVDNAASASLKGVEAEVTVIPFMEALPGLQIGGTLGYIDTEYGEFFIERDPIGAPGVLEDASHRSFARVPEWSYSLSGTYVAPFDQGDLTIRADYSWRDDMDLAPNNENPARISEAVGQLNAKVGFDFADYGLTISGLCKNCTNKTIKTAALDLAALSGSFMAAFAPPRVYGAEISWRFGGE